MLQPTQQIFFVWSVRLFWSECSNYGSCGVLADERRKRTRRRRKKATPKPATPFTSHHNLLRGPGDGRVGSLSPTPSSGAHVRERAI